MSISELEAQEADCKEHKMKCVLCGYPMMFDRDKSLAEELVDDEYYPPEFTEDDEYEKWNKEIEKQDALIIKLQKNRQEQGKGRGKKYWESVAKIAAEHYTTK